MIFWICLAVFVIIFSNIILHSLPREHLVDAFRYLSAGNKNGVVLPAVFENIISHSSISLTFQEELKNYYFTVAGATKLMNAFGVTVDSSYDHYLSNEWTMAKTKWQGMGAPDIVYDIGNLLTFTACMDCFKNTRPQKKFTSSVVASNQELQVVLNELAELYNLTLAGNQSGKWFNNFPANLFTLMLLYSKTCLLKVDYKDIVVFGSFLTQVSEYCHAESMQSVVNAKIAGNPKPSSIVVCDPPTRIETSVPILQIEKLNLLLFGPKGKTELYNHLYTGFEDLRDEARELGIKGYYNLFLDYLLYPNLKDVHSWALKYEKWTNALNSAYETVKPASIDSWRVHYKPFLKDKCLASNILKARLEESVDWRRVIVNPSLDLLSRCNGFALGLPVYIKEAVNAYQTNNNLDYLNLIAVKSIIARIDSCLKTIQLDPYQRGTISIIFLFARNTMYVDGEVYAVAKQNIQADIESLSEKSRQLINTPISHLIVEVAAQIIFSVQVAEKLAENKLMLIIPTYDLVDVSQKSPRVKGSSFHSCVHYINSI